MFALFFITRSLKNNRFVLERHRSLADIMAFTAFIILIISVIFMLYAFFFMIKRRQKEFALYGILGLEKKHIFVIILFEQIFNFIAIGTIALSVGYILGKLIFIAAIFMIDGSAGNSGNFTFNMSSAVETFLILLVISLFLQIVSTLRVAISSPISLLSQQSRGEAEPRTKVLLLILGTILLVIGYYFGITSRGLRSLSVFFPAVTIVIVATYFLFISLTIFVLKMIKRNKKVYYRPQQFLSVSGMLYRMKANAVGLASIALLSCVAIVTVTVCSVLSYNMREFINQYMDCDLVITVQQEKNLEGHSQQRMEELKSFKNDVNRYIHAEWPDLKNVDTILVGKNYGIVTPQGDIVSVENSRNDKDVLSITYADEYENYSGKKLDIQDNEVYLVQDNATVKEKKDFTIFGQSFKLHIIEGGKTVGLRADRGIVLIFKDKETADKICKLSGMAYPQYESVSQLTYGEKTTEKAIDKSQLVFLENDKIQDFKSKISEKYTHISFSSKLQMLHDYLQLNAGFLVLGAFIGAVALMGIVLVTYYKQLSTAFDDRESYHVMTKVGLSSTLIKKSTRVQILWMFFLPLIVAIIHSLAASPLLYSLIGLFGFQSLKNYIYGFVATVGFFSLAYFLVFLWTSRIYYQIVKH